MDDDLVVLFAGQQGPGIEVHDRTELTAGVVEGDFRFKDSRILGHLFQFKRFAATGFDDEAGIALPPSKEAE